MSEFWVNNKNKKKYLVMNKDVTNATNNDDGTKMYLYRCLEGPNPEKVYVREEAEFLVKFTKAGV